MHFHALVEEVRHLSLSEKEEMRSLLDRLVAKERRAEIAARHQEGLEELRNGGLELSDDPTRLRDLMKS